MVPSRNSHHVGRRRYTEEIKGEPVPGLLTEEDVFRCAPTSHSSEISLRKAWLTLAPAPTNFRALGLEYKAPHERDV